MLGDGVPVGRDHFAYGRHAGFAGACAECGQQSGTLLPILRNHLVKCFDPFCDLSGQIFLNGLVYLGRHVVPLCVSFIGYHRCL